jgi:hypothetical protein
MTDITKEAFAERIRTRLRDHANSKSNTTSTDRTRASAVGVTVSTAVTTADPVTYLTTVDINGTNIKDMCKSFLKFYSRMRKLDFRRRTNSGYDSHYSRYGRVGSDVDGTSSGISTSALSPLNKGEHIDYSEYDDVITAIRSVLTTNMDKVAYTITYCHSSCHSNCHSSRGRR